MNLKPCIMDRKLPALLIAILISVSLSAQESKGQKKDTRTFLDGIPKNSVYGELGGNGLFGSINYERILALPDKVALAPRAGLGVWAGLIPLIELDFLFGGKHSFEIGPGYSVVFAADGSVVTFRAGYRYMGKKGLLIRAAPMLWLGIDNGEAHPLAHLGLSVGYSF